MASQAEVASKKINAPQNAKKGQDLKPTNDGSKNVKDLIGSSVNKAQYLKSPSVNSLSSQPSLIAQAKDADLRDSLKIKPLSTAVATAAAPVNSPGLTFGTPSAFGANWGDAFVGASAASASKGRDYELDGSISAGFGLGNARETVGLEVTFNNGSIKRFGSNGTFDAKLHRIVYSEGSNQVGIAVGMNTFAQYGTEAVVPSSIYGAVTSYSQLQPDNEINKMPISVTVGAGGGGFRQGNASTGVFAGVGVQVAPQLSLGAGWSGIGLNAGLSYVPVPSIPLTVGLTAADLTDNSAGGRVFVLSIGYGFNFLPK
ncbi:MAG: hypothetical protein LH649_04570 [Pseudanabaena sp. CAN_BIN31]|nr:hypothetical protein [Pseudanabaena sp. CAN_BIN31]